MKLNFTLYNYSKFNILYWLAFSSFIQAAKDSFQSGTATLNVFLIFDLSSTE